MTAATPTLDPTAEPLLDIPDRRVCELPELCQAAATWAVSATGPCDCDDNAPMTVLWCDLHTAAAQARGVCCFDCGLLLTITWMERL